MTAPAPVPGWARAEWAALLGLASALGIEHAREIHWAPFVAAFLAIDLVGYLPGAIAFHRARRGPIASIYHHLYNVAHSLITAAAAVIAWAIGGGGFEWAMLAIPIHLCGDRALFGNARKPVGFLFEAAS